jgi:ribosomal RNA assembly protein
MQDEFQYDLKIPKERVAVLIGVDGKIKKEIEEKTKTKINVDSESGEVFINGKDGLNIFDAKEVVQAIGRGFNPKIAMNLLKGDYVFEIINIKDYANSQKAMLRLKGRVIGEEGKSRRIIEELTEASISVYGKTVAIIGEPESCANAKQAIVSLLEGAPHPSVYRWLEKKRKIKKQEQMLQ